MKAIIILSLIASVALAQTKTKDLAYFCPPCHSGCDDLVFDKPGPCPHCGMTLAQQTHAERKTEMSRKPITVCFYLQDGVEVLDFAGPMEVFSYAGFNVFTVSKTKEPILSQGILKILPDYSMADAPAADVMAFFGGNASQGFDESVVSWIKSREKNTDYFFSVCTGAFAFGKAGILDNKTATTFHLSIEGLRKSFPKTKVLSDVRFVDNGNVITTAGISAGIDGALHLVAKLKGENAAKEAAAYMEYDKWVPKEGLVLSGNEKP
ncbi:DJ-1/PfpI family protein [Chryseolinea lacunae]|uniref:DJ-1/PfpI family protein n=1 Tax=Chryseolinea lacunae TaxID=2801331 RepID=A0ABS1KSG4_9BACT|nr:DJ-1/PfpI family protein [Chryseolinea lacunae]MBL0742405.1 DJ-1/PfpI family protein [Chryseolinea lacunae]